MKFRILIRRIWRIESSDLWLLEGQKLEGDLGHNMQGNVRLEGETVSVAIKSVAMVNGGPPDLEAVLLSIEKPCCNPRLLEGRELTSND
jgi:hypothetical protein